MNKATATKKQKVVETYQGMCKAYGEENVTQKMVTELINKAGFKISETMVGKYLRDSSISTKKNKCREWSKEDEEYIISEVELGTPQSQIAVHFNTSLPSIQHQVSKLRIQGRLGISERSLRRKEEAENLEKYGEKLDDLLDKLIGEPINE